MEHKKQSFKIQWVLLLLCAPSLIGVLFVVLTQPTKPGAWFTRFESQQTLVYRGYPMVRNVRQSNYVKKTKHKASMGQPFYLEPLKRDPRKARALVGFLSSASNHDPMQAEKKCVFHADLLLEVGGYPFGSHALVCTSCGDVWIGSAASYDNAIAIKPEKMPEMKRLVFEILGKPAEWPPELQD